MQSCYNGLLLIRCGVVVIILSGLFVWGGFFFFFFALTVLSDANKVYFFFSKPVCLSGPFALSFSARACLLSHEVARGKGLGLLHQCATLKCQLWGFGVGLGVYTFCGKFSLSGMLTVLRHEWMLDLITLFSVSVALIIHVFSSLIRWTASIDFQMFNLPSIPLGYNE